MKNWLVINLGDAMLADASQQHLTALLQAAYQHAARADDMAAFIRHESAGHLYCEVKIYLSPALAQVLKPQGAFVCAKPAKHDLSLLLGTEKSWDVLFGW